MKRSVSITLIAAMFFSMFVSIGGVTNAMNVLEPSTGPFGPNVYVFDSSTPNTEIQSISTEIFNRQETNEFGNERYSILFKPGTYESNVRVGFYTHVAGLGQMPDDVRINGGVTADAEWWRNADGSKNATKNFWRSVENLSIQPKTGINKWAVSQAVPFRRVHVLGDLQLHDGGWASGGFLADSKIDGKVESGGQQQWFSRNSNMAAWTGGQWNTVFLGINNAPEDNWPAKPNTVIDEAPIMREKPFLTVDENDEYQVFVPDLQKNTKGASWDQGPTPGKSISLEQFYIADPNLSNAASINSALEEGKHLLFTPGIYHLDETIHVKNADTILLGLGFATLMPHQGITALAVDDLDGVIVAGLLFDAGSENSAALMEVGLEGSKIDHSNNPISLHDLFFRVGGGAAIGKADVSLKINSNNVIGDHFWIWRADHGTDVGWEKNTTKNGLVVNGDHVTIYGLFVEHYHEYQTLWNGDHGRMYFYQSEIPYDVPDQESWMSNEGTVNGFAAYKVADDVTSHEAYGLGIYSFFRDAPVKLHRAIEVPSTSGIKIHHATTVFLAGTTGSEITHVVNDFGNAVIRPGHRQTIVEYNGHIDKVSAVHVVGEGNRSAIATKGGTLQMLGNVEPTNATDKRIAWSVVNVTGKASIDSSGVLKAISDGTVEVIGTAQDGSGSLGSTIITIYGQTTILGNSWSWVRENKENWMLDSTNPNAIILTTLEGRWTATSGPSNILLRQFDTEDNFSISTKLNFAATAGYEWAGLIVYQDDGNAITLGRGSTNKIRFSQVKNTAQTDKEMTDPVAPADIYLKIEKTGTTYNGYYSSDGELWNPILDDKKSDIIATFENVSLNNIRNGLFTRKVGPSSKKAYLSNFMINDSIISFWNPVHSVMVTGEDDVLEITSKSGSLQMLANVLPADVDNNNVAWSVMNADGTVTDKATITTDGLLIAHRDGDVTVVATATDGSGVEGSQNIRISGQRIAVTSIEVYGEDDKDIINTKGGRLQMNAVTYPADADNGAVNWSVTNVDGTMTDKATITSDGVVTAIMNGQVKILAIAADDEHIVGELIIRISNQESDELTPIKPSIPTVTQNNHQQLINATQLNNIVDGRTLIMLDDAYTTALLPIDVVKLIDHDLEIKSQGTAIIIPLSVLQEQARTASSDSMLTVHIKQHESGSTATIEQFYTANGNSIELDVFMVEQGTQDKTLISGSEAIQVYLPFNPAIADKELLAIYKYDEINNRWVYAGGKVDNNQIKLTTSDIKGKFIVLEYNKTFTDVAADHWAYRSLKVLAAKHVVTGSTDLLYEPNVKTTRAEFVSMLVRALELKGSNTSLKFNDVHATDWYAMNIAAAYEAGLIKGVTDDKFMPNESMTREQMALLICRAYELIVGEIVVTSNHTFDLKDQNQVSSWAMTDLNKVLEHGLMKGKSDRRFDPQANATRAETAQAIYNLLQLIMNR